MKKGLAYETEIDVAPIINVSLVVVLTLMLIAPFLCDSEKQVNLPEAHASEVDDADNIDVTFTLQREIFVGQQQLQLAEVRPYLSALLAGAPDGVAVIKADRALPYGEVEKLIAEVEAAQACRIAIATRQKHGGGE
jgi:biopolymer transport protein TolR